MNATSLIPLLLALVLAPVVPAVINRTKAFVAGRVGQPLLQPYHDLWKLLRKGAVYSGTTSVIFQAGPAIGLAAVIGALTLVPFGAFPALGPFEADLILIGYLLALARFAMILAALDTGSSFEAMGASREAVLSAFAEPAFFLALAALARLSGSLSLSSALGAISPQLWTRAAPALSLIIAALALVFVAENARIPVDDPATHLELTMIHEVMVLDHGGVDLAMIEYAAALKLWLLGAIIVGAAFPWHTQSALLDLGIGLAAMLGLGLAVGVVESSMARLRLLRVPQLLVAASVLSGLAVALMGR